VKNELVKDDKKKFNYQKTFDYPIRIFQNFIVVWYIYMGIKLEIFDFMKNDRYSINIIANKLKLRKEMLKSWCEAMVAEGLMLRKTTKGENTEYKLTDWTRKHLCTDSKSYIGFIIEAKDYFTNAFLRFDNNFRKDKPFLEYTPDQMLGIAENIAPIANYVTPLIINEIGTIPDKLDILDLGCGLGYYIFNIIKLIPKSKALGIDIEPLILHRAREVAEEQGLSNNIEFKEVNVLKLNLKEKFDLIILSNIVQAFNRDQNVRIFNNISQNLKQNGKIIIIDCLLDTDKKDAKFNIFFNLYLKFESKTANLYTLNELIDMMGNKTIQFKKYDHLMFGIDMIVFERG
jgi:SAM-dependent methyltransferase